MRKVNANQTTFGYRDIGEVDLLGRVIARRVIVRRDEVEIQQVEWTTDADEDRALAAGDLVLDADAVASMNDDDPPLLRRAVGEE